MPVSLRSRSYVPEFDQSNGSALAARPPERASGDLSPPRNQCMKWDRSAPAHQPLLTHINANGEAQMVDVGDKPLTERRALASGKVTMKPETLALLKGGQLKKGDAFTVAKIAGMLAVKKTSELIPLCHPLPLDSIAIHFKDCPDPDKSGIVIEVEVRAFAKTGVEMEALSGVMITALSIYDMAKAYDPAMTVSHVHLVQKTGGKSDYNSKSRNSDSQ